MSDELGRPRRSKQCLVFSLFPTVERVFVLTESASGTFPIPFAGLIQLSMTSKKES